MLPCLVRIDVETGLPELIPPGVKLAFLQAAKDQMPELADMTFRTRGLRKESRKGLPMVCSSETGKSDEVNCGSCRRCFK